ncbi:MAG TPA: DUF4296 domain-containing protein [Paludibacter sp.]
MWNLRIKFFSQFAVIVSLLLVLASCSDRPKGVLNQEDMANILTDMHKLDGALVERGIMFSNDSTKMKYYNFVFAKYSISKANFDSSLVWYTKKPQEFNNIYNKVLLNLSLQEKVIKSGKYHFIDSVELAKVKSEIWKKRTKYALTKDSTRTRLDFEVVDPSLLYGDVFVLRFLLRIAPEDSCTKQHIALRLNYQNGKVDSAFAVAHHDSLLRRYTIKLPATRKLKIKSISGELLGSKAYKGKLHATLDSISLIRKFNPVFQDSLRKLVQKLEPKRKVIPKKGKVVQQQQVKKVSQKPQSTPK